MSEGREKPSPPEKTGPPGSGDWGQLDALEKGPPSPAAFPRASCQALPASSKRSKMWSERRKRAPRQRKT
eukprot:170715-Pyramimonas_sp.AAC.1